MNRNLLSIKLHSYILKSLLLSRDQAGMKLQTLVLGIWCLVQHYRDKLFSFTDFQNVLSNGL